MRMDHICCQPFGKHFSSLCLPALQSQGVDAALGGGNNGSQMNIWNDMQAELDELAAANLLRSPEVLDSPCGPRITVAGRELVCMCSNDYLGLANDVAVKQAAVEAIEKWGLGAGASRLVSGTMQPHVELERSLASFKHTEAAIVTSTGWMANHAAVHAFVSKGDLVLCDKLNHASILDAARSGGAVMRTYRHGDVESLAKLLDKHRAKHKRCLIVTDSLFSMDGDFAPLKDIVELKLRFDAQLLIDEAHATGVIGRDGRGVAELLEVEPDVDAVVGTLSKALGGFGGFVAGKSVLIETICNTAREFIYTTAPPPALCAGAIKSIEIIQTQPQRRKHLLELAELLRSHLAKAGFDTLNSQSQIVPIIIGSTDAALEISQKLMGEGFFVPAIRPPTVKRGTSRLRVSLSTAHTEADIDAFLTSISRVKQK